MIFKALWVLTELFENLFGRPEFFDLLLPANTLTSISNWPSIVSSGQRVLAIGQSTTVTNVPRLPHTICVSAFTKVNLSLRVVGRKEDGLHLLDMLVAPTTFGDSVELCLGSATGEVDLTLQEAAGGYLGDAVAALVGEGRERNLAVRAWKWFFSHVGIRDPGGQIKIVKVVPIGGGLGGGSADAAAVIRGLLAILERGELEGQNDLNLDQLAAASVVLGADVPVLLTGQWARVRGVGEIIERVSMPALEGRPIAICWPGLGLNTAEVFRMFKEANLPFSDLSAELDERLLYVNDLERSARKIEPRVGYVLDALRAFRLEGDVGLGSVVMTGSGSCVVVVSGDACGASVDAGMTMSSAERAAARQIERLSRAEEFIAGVRTALSRFDWVRVFPAFLGGGER